MHVKPFFIIIIIIILFLMYSIELPCSKPVALMLPFFKNTLFNIVRLVILSFFSN